uniref:Nudix hydrolase domain-containing protein n=1 Tax=Quercus lobata TaxID=97700 RepID=A0A7N2LDQ0_QUELO
MKMGGWENDETVLEAAVREAIEEAGVRGELMDFLGYYPFKSKTHQDEFCPDGSCKAAMFALLVKEELESWPEQSTRNRTWLTVPEALDSKTHQDEFCPDGSCKAAMFALLVKEELESWPEQSTRNRTWLTVPEALDRCRNPWMRDALENGFSKWHAGKDI